MDKFVITKPMNPLSNFFKAFGKLMIIHHDDIMGKTCPHLGLNPPFFNHNPRPLLFDDHVTW